MVRSCFSIGGSTTSPIACGSVGNSRSSEKDVFIQLPPALACSRPVYDSIAANLDCVCARGESSPSSRSI